MSEYFSINKGYIPIWFTSKVSYILGRCIVCGNLIYDEEDFMKDKDGVLMHSHCNSKYYMDH